jgi:8-oxo-dGTP pyrophosphatase MutT (NUDIX family)
VTPLTPGFLPRLTSALGRRTPATLTDEAAHRAAVAIVVTEEAEPSLLFVKRRERVGDPWSGHAAFPGGFRDQADASAIGTAQRETEEETGLPLAAVGRPVGSLDDVYPRSVYLPRVIVTPVVFAVPRRLDVRPSGEIERAVWVPVSEVFSPGRRRQFTIELPHGPMEFDSIEVAGLVVWGLTERILRQIATVIQS